MECKEYAHHLSRHVTDFPAPLASLNCWNSCLFQGLHLHSFLPLFQPSHSHPLPFFLSHDLMKTTSSWKPSINIPGRGPFSSVPEQSLPSSGKCWALLLCVPSVPVGVLSLAFPTCPLAKGDCSSLEAGIISSSVALASASSVRTAM